MIKNQYSSTALTINLQAIRDNYRVLCNKARKAKVAAVVKADAYGLGLKEVATSLIQEGCDTFFVANLDEAIALRMIKTEITIFVFHGIMPGQENVFITFGLIPVLNTVSQMNLWGGHAKKLCRRLPYVLHFDTGMHRLGISNDQWPVKNTEGDQIVLGNFSSIVPSSLYPLYIMTHLACSDEESNPMNAEQLAQLKSIAKDFEKVSLSIANSGGIFLGDEYHLDLVRPGIAIYGANPSASLPNPMKNVIKLTSEILQIQQVDRACAVGYGAVHRVVRGTKIATVAVGYADGYLRSLSNEGICAIDGVIVPVIGRVSMDLVTIDVTKIPDEVLAKCDGIELIGENIPVDVVAKKAGTISYEILTSLGDRYRRIYM